MPLAVLAVALAVAAPLTPTELAPLLPVGAAAEVKAALDAGRWAEVASRLARSQAPAAAFLRATALVEAGRPSEALAPLAGLEAKLPEISDRVAFLRGRALEAVGRRQEAVAAFQQVPDGSLLSPDARIARGRIAVALGDVRPGLEALAPLLESTAPPDPPVPDRVATAFLVEGRLCAAAGDREAARRAYLVCWAEHPLAPESAECRSAIAVLPAPWGGPPAREEVLRRAEALLDANRNEAALGLLGPLLEGLPEAGPGESFACRAHAAAGRAYRKERSYARAIEELRPVVDRCDDPDLRVRALYLLASATSIAADKAEATELYRRLAREFPQSPLADDALFFAADLLARDGRTDEARAALSSIVRDHPGGDRRDEARFRLAWLSKQVGDAEAAVAQLLAIEQDPAVDGYEHARAAYWRARLLASRGGEAVREARAIWGELAAAHPADYYGLLSRARLEGDGAAPADAVVPASAAGEAAAPSWDPGRLRDDPHFRAGVLLMRIGLARDASQELAAVVPSLLRGAGDGGQDAVLAVADLLDRAGDHRAAHNLLRTRARAILRAPPAGPNLRVWRIAYPPAYREDVLRWAPPAGVPVELVQAIMREESALDPRAVSPAGAIGLTQLMLPTARSVARQLGIGRVGREELTRASTNIRIGARFLGSLVRRFDGSIPLAIAAYNAGGGAVSRWLEQRRGLPLDEFVEEIPYEETRGYVKRVLRSYAAYRLIYGAPREPSPARLLGGSVKS